MERTHRVNIASFMIAASIFAWLAVTPLADAQDGVTGTSAPGPALERIRNSGRIRLGYYEDAGPFSFRIASGEAQGYSVAICLRVAESIRTEVGRSTLEVDWVSIRGKGRAQALQQGQIDLLCGADRVTLAARQTVSFSIPVFPGGIGAVLRVDAPVRLREILLGQPPSSPTWRASSGQLLQVQTFAVVTGSTAPAWLAGKLNDFTLTARVVPVTDSNAALESLLSRKASVAFGDRAVLREAIAHNPSRRDLVLLDRFFTYEPVALVLARGDDSLRLTVDRALSNLYASGNIGPIYATWFGQPPADDVLNFFRWNTIPQ